MAAELKQYLQFSLLIHVLFQILDTPGRYASAATIDCPDKCYCRHVDKKKSFLQVYCENNGLSAIGDIAKHLPKEVVDLSFAGNHLTRLEQGVFSELKGLKTLYLSRNSFTAFNKEFLDVMKSLPDKFRAIDLSDNPWDCSCTPENKNFISWVITKKGPRFTPDKDEWIAFINGYKTVCSTPLNLKGRRIDELVISDICPG